MTDRDSPLAAAAGEGGQGPVQPALGKAPNSDVPTLLEAQQPSSHAHHLVAEGALRQSSLTIILRQGAPSPELFVLAVRAVSAPVRTALAPSPQRRGSENEVASFGIDVGWAVGGLGSIVRHPGGRRNVLVVGEFNRVHGVQSDDQSSVSSKPHASSQAVLSRSGPAPRPTHVN